MGARIDKHRLERDDRWSTVEALVELASAVEEAGSSSVLIDFCTLWLSNIMLAERDLESVVEHLLSALHSSAARIVLVTNEVGSGIVPENALARRFRDAAGQMNQQIAAVCDELWLCVSGHPIQVKPQ